MNLLHCLSMIEAPGIAAGLVAAWATAVRLGWRRGKTALQP
jgi:hypothetical protein